MGIKGLLKDLARSAESITIEEMAGSIVAIDGSGWLHKGIYACAKELFLQQHTDSYIRFFMNNIETLLKKGITPLVVFDGPNPLPAKAEVAAERRQIRSTAKMNALLAISQGRGNEADARRHFCSAVGVTPDMVDNVIKALKNRGVDYVVAPYEADPQLALMSISGTADYVITEDADLLVFGAKQVVYKWDGHRGQLIRSIHLYRSFPDIHNFTFQKFQYICILSGCDYLKSIPDIGLQRAKIFVKALEDKDIFEYIKNIGTIVGRSITIPPGYKENLKKAIYTFKHQTVYHPDKGYVPLNDYPPGVSAVDLDYAGLPLPDAPVVDLSRTWISVQMLDKTDLTDVTFHGSETSDAGSSQSSSGPHYTLRSTQAQECTVMAVGEGLKWTPPCFPVMTLTFLKASVSMDGDLKSSLFKASDHRLLLSPPPFNIAVKKSCSITVDNVEYFVVWSWDHLALCDTISEDTLSQGTRSTFSSVQTVSESDYVSESDSDNDVVEEESDSDKDSVEPHELAFKVMGVTYKHRYQEVLEEAFMAIKDDNRTPPADIVAEPDNPHDQNAIAVRIYTKNGAEKVGYIQREVTPYVHNVINSNTLAGVRIGHIAFRVTWYHPGWYMKLMITKLGKWEMPVILKSYRVK